MGREIKRVPLDFDWPKDVVWGGFLNPFYKQSTKCPDCDGRGSTAAYRELEHRWYGHVPFKPEDRGSKPFLPTDLVIVRRAGNNAAQARYLCDHFNSSWCHHLNADDVAVLVKSNRLRDLTHVWTGEKGWQPKNPPVTPTPRQVNEWSLTGFGHDSINCWTVCNAEAERLGITIECARCHGEGTLWPTPKIKRQCDRWKETEPPKGDGYQLWETVSEGSPISPVFATPEELADWLVNSPDYRWRKNDSGTTREQWLQFIRGPGWAPSLISDDHGVRTGVQAVATNI